MQPKTAVKCRPTFLRRDRVSIRVDSSYSKNYFDHIVRRKCGKRTFKASKTFVARYSVENVTSNTAIHFCISYVSIAGCAQTEFLNGEGVAPFFIH